MSYGSLPLSLEDVKIILDRALNARVGVRVPFSTRGQAIYWRGRANYFRRLDRRENAHIYDESHQLHKQSIYDSLRFYLEGSTIIIKKISATVPHNIEELE
jgi:hypothetical protein